MLCSTRGRIRNFPCDYRNNFSTIGGEGLPLVLTPKGRGNKQNKPESRKKIKNNFPFKISFGKNLQEKERERLFLLLLHVHKKCCKGSLSSTSLLQERCEHE
jgi:hypothetical protein